MYVIETAFTGNANYYVKKSDRERDKIVYLTNTKILATILVVTGKTVTSIPSLSTYGKSKIARCAFHLPMANLLCSK